MKKSILTKSQKMKKSFSVNTEEYGLVNIILEIRYDDECGNRHNTFAITGDVYTSGKPKTDYNCITSGCIHDIIEKYIPEYAYLIKWHSCTSEGPLYYIENTLYHASDVKEMHHFFYLNKTELFDDTLIGLYDDAMLEKVKERFGGFVYTIKSKPTYRCHDADIDAARNTAIWPDATLEQLRDVEALKARLPKLMEEFADDMEQLGFIF